MIIVDEQIPLLSETLSVDEEVLVLNGRSITNEIIRSSGATALFIRSTTRVDSSLLDKTSVEFVASATAGVDHVDVEFLRRKNITFFYAAGSNAPAVAEYVSECISTFTSTSSFVLGIIGHGHVGSLLRKQLVANGLTVLVNDPPLLTQGKLDAEGALIVDDVEDLLRGSDVVSLHVPLTFEEPFPTHHLVDTHQLHCMKSDALLINTSRGGAINESAFLNIKSQRPKLILDVFEDEPTLSTEILQACSVATPHIAGYTTEAKLRGAQMVLKAYAAFRGIDVATPSISAASANSHGRLESPLQATWQDGYGAEEFDALRANYLAQH